LTPFFNYAVEGLRDGLHETHETVNDSQILVFWQRLIYDTFAGMEYTKKDAHRRKRKLMLNFPLCENLTLEEIPLKTGVIEYAGKAASALYRDVKEMETLGLLVKSDDKKFHANWRRVCQNYFDPVKILEGTL
jgi:hypothetical protein